MQHQAFQDRDWEFSVYIQNAIGERIDITGSTWAFKLFDAPGGTPVLSALSGSGITLTDAGAGRMDIAFDDSVMTIGPGNYAAELVRTDTGADVYGVWPVVVGLEGSLNGGTGDIVIRPSDAIQLRAVNAPAGPAAATLAGLDIAGTTQATPTGGDLVPFYDASAAANRAFDFKHTQNDAIGIVVGDETTGISTGTAKRTFRMPQAFACTSAKTSLTTAGTGVTAVDVNKNGVSIFTTTPKIDSGELTSATGTAAVLATNPTLFADDDEVTVDVDQAASGGKGLKVYLNGYWRY